MPDPKELHQEIIERLDRVKDPCSVAAGVPSGLAEMGLVASVEIGAGGAVSIALRLTSPFCHMIAFMQEQAGHEVGSLPGVTSVTVTGDAGLDWSPDMMSGPAAQRRRRHLEVMAAR